MFTSIEINLTRTDIQKVKGAASSVCFDYYSYFPMRNRPAAGSGFIDYKEPVLVVL